MLKRSMRLLRSAVFLSIVGRLSFPAMLLRSPSGSPGSGWCVSATQWRWLLHTPRSSGMHLAKRDAKAWKSGRTTKSMKPTCKQGKDTEV